MTRHDLDVFKHYPEPSGLYSCYYGFPRKTLLKSAPQNPLIFKYRRFYSYLDNRFGHAIIVMARKIARIWDRYFCISVDDGVPDH